MGSALVARLMGGRSAWLLACSMMLSLACPQRPPYPQTAPMERDSPMDRSTKSPLCRREEAFIGKGVIGSPNATLFVTIARFGCPLGASQGVHFSTVKSSLRFALHPVRVSASNGPDGHCRNLNCSV